PVRAEQAITDVHVEGRCELARVVLVGVELACVEREVLEQDELFGALLRKELVGDRAEVFVWDQYVHGEQLREAGADGLDVGSRLAAGRWAPLRADDQASTAIEQPTQTGRGHQHLRIVEQAAV